MKSARRVMLAGALGIVVIFTSAVGVVNASQGSVPAEVAAYVREGGLIDRLDDLYGPDGHGSGQDFRQAKPGEIMRVFGWSQAKLAGEQTELAITMRNEWVTSLVVGEQVLGVATIWINPETVLPELAHFEADAELVAALVEVPQAAALVHDERVSAWFVVEAGIATPLVPGSSGVRTPTPVVALQLSESENVRPGTADSNVGGGILAILVLVGVTIFALLIPSRIGAAIRRGSVPTKAGDDASP